MASTATFQPPRAPLPRATPSAGWLLLQHRSHAAKRGRKEEPFSKILDDAAAGKVQAVRVGADRCEITLKSGRSYDAKHVPWLGTDWLATRLREHGVRFGALTVPELTRDEKRRAVAKGLFAVLAPAAYLYFAYRILMKASRGPHQDESVANQYQRKKQRKRGFAGVAGVDKALRELREVVACLRDPAAFARIGARCPRGILLTGPSGTGKTLLALRRRGGRLRVPVVLGLGLRRVVCRAGLGARPQPVREGAVARAVRRLHRRDRRHRQGARHALAQRRARADAEPDPLRARRLRGQGRRRRGRAARRAPRGDEPARDLG